MELRKIEGESTLKEHYAAYEKLTGHKHPKLLEAPPLPLVCSYVWNWFLNLETKRQHNGFNYLPIQFSEMKSFFELEGIEPEPWEVNLISIFDSIALAQYNKSKPTKSKQSQKTIKSK